MTKEKKVSDKEFQKKWETHIKQITGIGYAFNNIEDVEELKKKRDDLIEMVKKAKKQRGDN